MANPEAQKPPQSFGEFTRRSLLIAGGIAGAGYMVNQLFPASEADKSFYSTWGASSPPSPTGIPSRGERPLPTSTRAIIRPTATAMPDKKSLTLLSDEEILPGELPVEGNHFLTPNKIKEILARNNSPAINAADAFYTLGKKFDIGAAIPLAFFYKESQMGLKGVATETKSIGNIRYTGAPFTNIEGYNGYVSYEEGIYDWYDLIRNYYIKKRKLDTVEKIVPVYAPSADNNNEQAYIATVRWCWLKWYREVNS